MTTRIIIFAKAPQPGLAKTRLIPALGISGSAKLAHRMLTHTLEHAIAADIGQVELCVTPSFHTPAWQTFNLPIGIQLSEQGEGDLGQRMARATQRAITLGDSVILIGTDCPSLDSIQLRKASYSLANMDAVITPAFDGGYVLLGLHQFHASLFNNIAWSTDSVATTTKHRLALLDWKVHLNDKLHDIDEPSDLQWLPDSWLESIQDINSF